MGELGTAGVELPSLTGLVRMRSTGPRAVWLAFYGVLPGDVSRQLASAHLADGRAGHG